VPFKSGQKVDFPVASGSDATAKGTVKFVCGKSVTITPAAGQKQFDGVPTVVRMDNNGKLEVPPMKKA